MAVFGQGVTCVVVGASLMQRCTASAFLGSAGESFLSGEDSVVAPTHVRVRGHCGGGEVERRGHKRAAPDGAGGGEAPEGGGKGI